ncbi:MAG TPA: hypothetical protein PKI03_32210 [Pseudomonadota bacterium]|nr:hypothetical protein [Pseudomonadota bacterium]
MLELISEFLQSGGAGSASARAELVAGLAGFAQAVVASRGRGDRRLLLRAEGDVRAAPADCFRFDALGRATLYAGGRRYAAGRFEVLPLQVLSQRAAEAQAHRVERPAQLRLCVFDGAGPATDIGALQASAPPRTLFQVASQFNCLEAPGAFITEVADYLHDPTQGPRASVSAFPGTLLRHYAAPVVPVGTALPSGTFAARRMVQVTDGPQLNLLAAACQPGIATVRNGYLRPDDVADPEAFASRLTAGFDALCVGVHEDVEVVLGADWDGAVAGAPHRRISQVFTSTMAAGMYGELRREEAAIAHILQTLQRLAYLGTLRAAAAHGHDYVVLTLIGGGVFGNPLPVIWRAIQWALSEVASQLHRDLVVIVNGRNLGEHIDPRELADAAHSRGGVLLRFGKTLTEVV